jgi:hypothetical protein
VFLCSGLHWSKHTPLLGWPRRLLAPGGYRLIGRQLFSEPVGAVQAQLGRQHLAHNRLVQRVRPVFGGGGKEGGALCWRAAFVGNQQAVPYADALPTTHAPPTRPKTPGSRQQQNAIRTTPRKRRATFGPA